MRPFSLLIKPSGPDCNLACRYCFYTDRACIFGQGKHRMSDAVRHKLITDYMGLNLSPSSFAWQGGEPTLMGLDFYRKVVKHQQKVGRPGQIVSNALQTNAVLLDEHWCEFLAEYQWLVGISLDGPREFHDHYRLDKGQNGTFERVIAAIEKCRKHQVQFNILTLLNAKNVKEPDKLFQFFMDLNIKYMQFIPCLEWDEQAATIASYAITPDEYGVFLCRIFDLWQDHGYDKVSIRMFDSLLSYILHGKHSICTFGQRCDDYIVVEHNGDVFCCDFFVGLDYRLGNIMETPIDQLYHNEVKRRFARLKRNINNKCLTCRYKSICLGGCLKDRIVEKNNFSQPSYFCRAYQKLFDHALPRLKQIAAHLIQ